MKAFLWIFLVTLGGFLLYFGLSRVAPPDSQATSANLIMEIEAPTGFQRADGPRPWAFPGDYGPHPDYQTEWWYYTGNLESDIGERFGYQLTFFRRALLPKQDRVERDSAWGTEQIYMAHFALSDVAADRHYAFERFTRGAVGLAGAQAEPYQVWLENWQVVEVAKNQYRLTAQQGEIAIDLTLENLKGPIFHGEQGYSQKGPEAGNASYYYSQTRLQTTGTVQTPDGSYTVTGLSWKDHEFSTSALSAGQVGWDWFSIQLEDGSELMVFQIRREDGSIDPFSSGTWVSPEGETTHLARDQFQIQVRDSWRSPHTGAEYPSAWTVEIPALRLSLEIEPYLADQEMDVSYAYWEGAVAVSGIANGNTISGNGYVEMTGYATSMEGEF
jgi:predicted secreted hydrolase